MRHLEIKPVARRDWRSVIRHFFLARRRVTPSANTTASESAVLIAVPSPRSCGERAARFFHLSQSGEGQPLTQSYRRRDRLALSPRERGEGTIITACAL